MSRARWTLGIGPVLSIAALAVAAAACETLIDLGPRARDENAAGSGASSACGFGQASTSPACVACLEQHCCQENLSCSADSRCAAQKVHLTDCIYDVSCIQGVLADAGTDSNVGQFSNCAAGCTVPCYPTGECLKLAQCCQGLSSIERHGCVDVVDSAEQARCFEARTTTFSCTN